MHRGCVIIPFCGICSGERHPFQQYPEAVSLVAEVFSLPSCFGHGLGGHVHHSQSSLIFCRCHRHTKIHVIHGGAFGDHVVGRSAEHHLFDHELYERLDPVVESFWVCFCLLALQARARLNNLQYLRVTVSMCYLFLDRFWECRCKFQIL